MSKQCLTGGWSSQFVQATSLASSSLDICPEARCSALTDRTNLTALSHWRVAAQIVLGRKPQSKNRCGMDRKILGKPALVCIVA